MFRVVNRPLPRSPHWRTAKGGFELDINTLPQFQNAARLKPRNGKVVLARGDILCASAAVGLLTVWLVRRWRSKPPKKGGQPPARSGFARVLSGVGKWTLFPLLSGVRWFVRDKKSVSKSDDDVETSAVQRAGREILRSYQEETSRLVAERVRLYGEICVEREKLRAEDSVHHALVEQLDRVNEFEAVATQNRDLLIDLLNERSELVRENVRLTREEEELRQMLQFAEGFLDEGCESDTGDTVVYQGDEDSDVSPLWFLREEAGPSDFFARLQDVDQELLLAEENPDAEIPDDPRDPGPFASVA
ncbi:hypothetical protein BSKO_11944 [Bryopsis sp. KO-2023]|nr:hypothetical protein BSKO_11944 [Bryopsis sp. KO-2023]